LCTIKYKVNGDEIVKVWENIFVILQKKVSLKYKDLRSFTIPCIIGNIRFKKAMLDLEESINDMLYCIYAYLNLGSLKNTSVIIQLTNQSNAYLKEVLKDFLM
jgi:hypothetical protein